MVGEKLALGRATARGVWDARNAWHEAVEKMGSVMAAAAFFVALQRHDAGKVSNLGGYFRSYTRMIGESRIDLVDEIQAMRRRRSH